MSIRRWDPLGEMSSLRRAMDRVFDQFGPTRIWMREEGPSELGFPVDMFETNDEIVLKCMLPGVKPEDVDISITGDSVTIKGEMRSEEQTQQGNYYRQEIHYGSFFRTIPLPTHVETERAEADFENGLLTIKLPKAEEVRPKSIKVRSKEPART